MNSLSFMEIINQAGREARKGSISALDENSSLAKEGRSHLKRIFQKLLSVYPWPNFTKRVELREEGEPADASGYAKRFLPPDDVMYIWDMYSVPTDSRQFAQTWDFGRYRGYSWPYDDYTGLAGTFGEILDGAIYTDYSPLYVLYTPQMEPLQQDPAIMPVQFTECLIKEMAILFEGTNTDPELKRLNIAMHQKDIASMKTQSAIENRKAWKMPRPVAISMIDSLRGNY